MTAARLAATGLCVAASLACAGLPFRQPDGENSEHSVALPTGQDADPATAAAEEDDEPLDLPDPPDDPPEAAKAPGAGAVHASTGRYWRWSAPAGWRASETGNGVDLVSENGSEAVSVNFVAGGVGSMSPEAYRRQLFQSIGMTPRVLSRSPLPPRPVGGGYQWVGEHDELSIVLRGVEFRGACDVAALNVPGSWSAGMSSWMGPAVKWPADGPRLAAIAHSVQQRPISGGGRAVAGGGGAAGAPPDGGAFDEQRREYEEHQASEDRLSQARREVMMGYETTEDADGNRYASPYSTYDPGRQAYVDPNQPTEDLTVVPPGE